MTEVAFRGVHDNPKSSVLYEFMSDGKVLVTSIVPGSSSNLHYGNWMWINELVMYRLNDVREADDWWTVDRFDIVVPRNAYESWLARKIVE